MNKINVQLVTKRSYTADGVGAFWSKKGQIVSILSRFMNDWDIQAGIKRGILKVVEEDVSKIEAAG